MKNDKAIIITRQHPKLNFGQTVKVLEHTCGTVVVRPDGFDGKYTLDISEIWPYSRAYEYEAYNEAVDKTNGWPWQNISK